MELRKFNYDCNYTQFGFKTFLPWMLKRKEIWNAVIRFCIRIISEKINRENEVEDGNLSRPAIEDNYNDDENAERVIDNLLLTN